MPWVADSDVLSAVASIHRLRDTSTAPAHWAALVSMSNSQAYNRIRERLLEVGFSASAIDQWGRNQEFNLRGAIALTLNLIGLPEGQEGLSLTTYMKVWDELEKIEKLFDANGNNLTETNTSFRVNTGSYLPTCEDQDPLRIM